MLLVFQYIDAAEYKKKKLNTEGGGNLLIDFYLFIMNDNTSHIKDNVKKIEHIWFNYASEDTTVGLSSSH